MRVNDLIRLLKRLPKWHDVLIRVDDRGEGDWAAFDVGEARWDDDCESFSKGLSDNESGNVVVIYLQGK